MTITVRTTIALTLILITVPMMEAKIYKGAEYRTKGTFLYGRFEVRMKSAQREGMLSSFFTYHEITSVADWNEIDIEIMGRYADDIQFNPITRGQVNHVSHYQSSFNPSLDFHVYAFEWTPTYVAWFVEGKEVHRQTGAHIEGLNLPQKIMMNVWNPVYVNWAGEWNENVLPAFAYYDWVSYSSYTPDSGNTGTDSNFTSQWKDDFDTWDQSRWEKASHTFGGNNCDFLPENAVFKDGKLILCLTKESATGYVDNVAPNINSVRAERDGILVTFTEEVDSLTATNATNYLISGQTVAKATLMNDQKRVKLTVTEYDTASLSNLIIMNVKDRFDPPNALSVKSVAILKTTPLTLPVKINLGGPEYKDYLPDQMWGPAAEYGYMDGALHQNSFSIGGTLDPGVYNAELAGAAKYQVRIPNGKYTVFLMMAENYFSDTAKRIFSVAVQGTVVESNLDLFARIGKSKPFQKIVQNVEVTEGILDIHFMNTIDNSVLNGIQIIAALASINQRDDSTPGRWHIGQNYPNPFNGSTMIPIQLAEDDEITIRIYDTLGRKISDLPIGYVRKGSHTFSWNSFGTGDGPAGSGAYVYVVEGKHHRSVKKMLLLR